MSILSIDSRKFTKDSLTSLSPVFTKWLVKETGLKFAGSDVDPPLWIGETRPSLRMSGISPVWNEDFNILFNHRAILDPPFFS